MDAKLGYETTGFMFHCNGISELPGSLGIKLCGRWKMYVLTE